jgi:hypothetical protein
MKASFGIVGSRPGRFTLIRPSPDVGCFRPSTSTTVRWRRQSGGVTLLRADVPDVASASRGTHTLGVDSALSTLLPMLRTDQYWPDRRIFWLMSVTARLRIPVSF